MLPTCKIQELKNIAEKENKEKMYFKWDAYLCVYIFNWPSHFHYCLQQESSTNCIL